MSVHHLKNRPCPACGHDTLHRVNTCSECGAVNPVITANTYISETRRKLFKKYSFGGANAILAGKHKRIETARRKYQAEHGERIIDSKDFSGGPLPTGRGRPWP